jgi:dimeric dUTPase (all-alpha-NTP-PPase superfamily)
LSGTWNWLASTKTLQEEYFRRKFPVTDPDEFADYVTMNHSALIVELSEFMQEVGWKDWATPRGWVNRDAAVRELVDAGHFLANLLCALDVTDAEWESAYRAKQEVNRQRQRDGYDGVSGKCYACRRSYDDPATRCVAANAEEPAVCNG